MIYSLIVNLNWYEDISVDHHAGSLPLELMQSELVVVLGVFATEDLLFKLTEVLVGLFLLAHHPHRAHDQALACNPYHASNSD